MSIESIINQSLDLIGYKKHIGSIWEGSPAARAALNSWAQTRDALLIQVRPEWARREIALTVTKTAPALGYDDETPWTTDYPDMPWLYEYAQPAECLEPLALQSRPHTLPVWRPKPMRFRLKLNADGTDYVLLGNDPSPVLICVAKVPDTDFWHEEFTQIVIEAMARKLMPLFGSKAVMQEDRQEQQKQEQRNANSG